MALQYVNLPEHRITGISYGLVILGAVVAGIVAKSDTELSRAPYFAYCALITLLVSAAQIIWLQSIPALVGGYLWVLMIVSIAAAVIGGFFYGKIAIARSLDAYGHGRMAVLAFIPLANFWLLLKPSRKMLSHNRVPTILLMTGPLGVLSGFAMLMAVAFINVFIEQEANRMTKHAHIEPASQQASIAFMVKSQGIEEALRLMAADAQTPVVVDDVTTLARIDADGTQLRRTYVVDIEMAAISDEVRARSTNGICAYGPFISLLREGATIREVYVNANGSPIGAVMVSREVCGF